MDGRRRDISFRESALAAKAADAKKPRPVFDKGRIALLSWLGKSVRARPASWGLDPIYPYFQAMLNISNGTVHLGTMLALISVRLKNNSRERQMTVFLPMGSLLL